MRYYLSSFMIFLRLYYWVETINTDCNLFMQARLCAIAIYHYIFAH